MADIRIRTNSAQLTSVLHVLEQFLQERPKGETLNLLFAIAQRLHNKVVSLLLRHRYSGKDKITLQLSVDAALTLRRMVLTGMELYPEGEDRNRMRLLMLELDPRLTPFLK